MLFRSALAQDQTAPPPPVTAPAGAPLPGLSPEELLKFQEGKASVRFTFRYDQMLDEQGKWGVFFSFVPYSLCKPDEYGLYYTNGGLPTSMAMNFDQVLQSIWGGYGMALAVSLEPDPKPSYLLSRDNPMIGWGGAYPASRPNGYEVNAINGTLSLKTTCGTRIQAPFPPAYYNRCAAQ